MQVAVQESLCVVHKVQAESRRFGMQFLIAVQFLFDKAFISRRDDVAILIIIVRFGQHQILGDFAEFGIGKELHAALFLFRIQNQIRRRQKGIDHENRQVFTEVRVDPVRRELPPKIPESRNILHRRGSHDLVVMIHLRNKSGGKFSFQLQDGSLDSAAVLVQQPAGRTQEAVRLLDDSRMPVLQRPDAEDVVDVAVADFLTHSLFARCKQVKHFHRIALYRFGIHQKERIKFTHGFSIPAFQLSLISEHYTNRSGRSTAN